MYIHARVKGPKGSITLKPISARGRTPTADDLRAADEKARKLYFDTHGPDAPDVVTVDLKISKNP